MKIPGKIAVALVLVIEFGNAGTAMAAPLAPLGDLSRLDVEQAAAPSIVPPSPLVCEGSRRVCLRWHNIPGGMACSRWEQRFYGCRARR